MCYFFQTFEESHSFLRQFAHCPIKGQLKLVTTSFNKNNNNNNNNNNNLNVFVVASAKICSYTRNYVQK
jgi:hypothetical protein